MVEGFLAAGARIADAPANGGSVWQTWPARRRRSDSGWPSATRAPGPQRQTSHMVILLFFICFL
jgi:hypothetical protein